MEAVFTAARENNLEVLSRLVHQADISLIDATDQFGKTAVTIAVENKSFSVVKWLVDSGCRLSNAAITNSVNQLNSKCHPFISQFLPTSSESIQFYPPLLAAVTVHCVELAKLLLDSGRVQIDEAYKDITPLIKACIDGLPEMVILLLNYGAEVNGWPVNDDVDLESENPREWLYRPLYHAVQNGHGKIVDILSQNGARYISLGPVPCHSFWIEHWGWGSPSSQLQRCWGSVLELAVLKCNSKVEYLLDFYRRDISSFDVYYALVLAIQTRSIHTVEIFLNKYYLQPNGEIPAKLELSDSYCLAIRLAIRECRQEEETISLLLLQSFGSLLAQDIDGSRIVTLLYVAVLRNLPLVVAKVVDLLTSHFDKNTLRKCSAAATHLKDVRGTALYHGNLKILQTLLDAEILDLKTPSDAVFEVLACGRTGASVYETLCWLMEHNLDPRSRNINNMEPIHVAIKQQLPDAVDALCRLGVDANAQIPTVDALSPLQMHLNLCILQLGVEPQVHLLHTLIRHGSDLAMMNGQGYTPLSVLFWLVAASSQQIPSRQAPLSPNFKVASVSNMRCFPVHAAFVKVDKAQTQTDTTGTYEPIDSSTADSDDSFDEDSEFLVDSQDDHLSNRGNPDERRRLRKSSRNRAQDSPIPVYLQHDRPQRAFIEALVQKFGLELFSMGAALLIGSMQWHCMDLSLWRAGIRLRHVPKLKAMCWRTVRSSIGGVYFQHKVEQLPLPNSLKTYLIEL